MANLHAITVAILGTGTPFAPHWHTAVVHERLLAPACRSAREGCVLVGKDNGW